MHFSQFFLNWNEVSAKAENENILKNFLKIGMKLRLRQKKILSSNKLVELERICG